MNRTKDHFSRQANSYARYRPTYPADLFAYLAELAPARDVAWDAGTGSGQATVGLAEQFWCVVATDSSADQLAHAFSHQRVIYRQAPAEHSGLEPGSVDIATAAQALHWFDQPAYFAEVQRVLKPGGVIAAWCYHLTKIAPDVDRLLARYYNEVVGPYWEPCVQMVNRHYLDILFPFNELAPPQFTGETLWSLRDIIGYLESWSATQKFIEVRGSDPVDEIRDELVRAWRAAPEERRLVQWPLYLRVGRNAPG